MTDKEDEIEEANGVLTLATGDGNEAEEDGGEENGGHRFMDIYIPPPASHLHSESNKEGQKKDGTRLIITNIENENFKSYAGTQLLGPFHKCFNAIVGPNGSGKSNVIDSMLFVFGYRASKIRSKKLSVLIHTSDQAGARDSCTVAVHFVQIVDKATEGGLGYEKVPNTELVISRTAFRDNSSFYKLNGRRVQFKTVAALLRSHGIDLDHNRFLILQGEVEQIAMMKPKGLQEHETGMLEFIEDIVGTARYKEPLDKLFTVCDQLTEERVEKINRLKIVEKEKQALEKPVSEAILFLEKENEIAAKRYIMLQKNIHDHQKALDERQEAKTKIKGKIKEKKEEMKEMEDREKAYKKELAEMEKEHAVVNAEYEKLKEQFNNVNARDAGIQAEVVQMGKTRKKVKGQLAEERKKLAELERVPAKNEAEIAEMTALEERLDGERATAEEERDRVMSGMRAATQGLQDQKEKQETQLLGLQKSVTTSKDKFDMAQSALQLYLSTEQKEEAKLVQLKTSLETGTGTLKKLKEEVSQLQAQIPEDEATLREAQTELRQVQQEEGMQVQELRKARSALEETRLAQQATRSQGRVLSFLMQQRQQGHLPGMLGRLGDLGAIDAKYDVAVSTACGPLDNMVVDTVECAQASIRALKEKDVGRATFIALDKQEHLRSKAEGHIKTPENVPRLYDLIRVKDSRVKTAFYYALRDTLVANDLTQATRIAYGSVRYRVVTLEGQLIESSGTMSGGGRSKLRGRMGQQVAATASPKEQRALEVKHERLEQAVGALRERRAALEHRVAQLEKALPTQRMALNKNNIEIKSLEEQLPVIREQLKRQAEKVKEAKPDEAEVKRLTEERDREQAVYEKAAEEAGAVEKEVKKLHNKIMEMTKGKVSAAQKKLDDIMKKINKIRQERTKLGVGIKTAIRNQKMSKEKIANMETEISDMESKILKLQEEKAAIEANGAVFLKQMHKSVAEVSAKEEALAELKAQHQPGDNTAVRAAILELEQKIEEANKRITEYSTLIAQKKKKMGQITLHDVPGKTPPPLEVKTDEELEAMDEAHLQWEITLAERSLSDKAPNLSVIKEYKEKTEMFVQRSKELDEVTLRRNKAREVLEQVRQQRLAEFLDGYSIITHKLKEMYQMLTLGGDAELELVDSLDPFSEGIVFSVRPPKKSWKNISNLSGGEKTLSSLALVFALHYYKPSPLFVMDEIDAALDFKNVSIVGHYIKERTKNAQFIIISLRSNMFELADHLIGIYKTHDCTKSVAINPKFYASLNGLRDATQNTTQQQKTSKVNGSTKTIDITSKTNDTPKKTNETPKKTNETTKTKETSKSIETSPVLASGDKAFDRLLGDSRKRKSQSPE